MSPFRAGRLLKVGAQTPVKITVNGFRSVDLLTDRIARKLETSRDSLEKAMTDSVLLAKAPGINVDRRLAIFIEDTYEVYWNTSPQEPRRSPRTHSRRRDDNMLHRRRREQRQE